MATRATLAGLTRSSNVGGGVGIKSCLSSLVQRRFNSGNLANVRFPKQRRGTMKGTSDNRVSFGTFGLQALDYGWISAKQIEAGRRAVIRHARGGGKMWVRLFPHKSVTAKPAEVRMGRGKGGIKHWVAVAKPGRVFYEIGGVAEAIARKAMTIAGSKMPIRTKFVSRGVEN